MKKSALNNAVEHYKNATREALQMVFDELNNGQKKKLLKNEGIKALMDRYSVKYETE